MPLTVFTNIPNPHNRWFFDALRHEGCDLRVVYEGLPARLGRPWPIEPEPDDVITSSWRAERRELARARRGDDVILTGSYAGPTALARRVLSSWGSGTRWWWGERLRPRDGAEAWGRRLWFGAPGLDGVLAIGTRAASTYAGLAVPNLQIHVLPYATATGATTERNLADRPILGYAGRLLRYKGVDLVVRALSRIDRADRPQFEIAGRGPQQGALSTLARRLEVDITWLGELDEARLDHVRSRWWAQIVPSRASEGWGLVVNEALNAGVPVIASDFVGAAADLVRADVNGTIVRNHRTEDPEAWVEAMRPYLDRSTVDRQGVSARSIGRLFSADAAATWLLAFLRDPPHPGSPDRSFVRDGWTAAAHLGLT